MAVLFSATFGGRLQRYGASSGGSTSKIQLIAASQIPAVTSGNGNFAQVDKMKVTVAKGGSSSLFQLELSTDNVTYTEVARIEVPDSGIMSDPDVTLYIPAGYWYRVSVTQGTAARCSAALIGRTVISDIVDI